MKRTLFYLLAAFSIFTAPLSAWAASGYSMIVTGESEIVDGIDKAREETRILAAREVVLKAMEADIGRALVEQNMPILQNRLLPNVDDYLRSSRLIDERQAGNALFGTWQIEVDIARVRAGLKTAGVERTSQAPRLVLLWTQEKRRDADDSSSTFAGYLGTSWGAAATEPAVITQLQQRLLDNGLNIVPLSPELNKFTAEQLGQREVDKAFLRRFVKEADVDLVLFVRMVARPLDTPPAAKLKPNRVNHIAFLFDSASGQLRGAPLTATAVQIAGVDNPLSNEVPREWLDQLVERLVNVDSGSGVELAVLGLSSVGDFDALWQQLKNAPGLSEILPIQISAKQADFTLPNTRSAVEWERLLARALPQASVSNRDGKLQVDLRR